MCVTSADSRKAFLDPNTLGWHALFQQARRYLDQATEERGDHGRLYFIELILDTFQSPHFGSKLCFAKGTQLISSSLSVHQSLEIANRQQSSRNLELPGSPGRELLVWGVARLLGGDSSLTSPLGSILKLCTFV